MDHNDEKERREAYAAGQRALSSLQAAKDALDSARGWGIYEMLGGGFISTLIQHSRMDKAAECINRAKSELLAFGRELDDVNGYQNIDLSTGDFWGFADWFFDGLFSDWVMQGRINDARAQVDRAILKVKGILGQLR